jgi:hypothetical protein
MNIAPAQRAEGRDGARPRTLACTADGVWLWPAAPLTERRGGTLVPLPAPDLYPSSRAFMGRACISRRLSA